MNYLVRDVHGYVTVIEADEYEAVGTGLYTFLNRNEHSVPTRVASFPVHVVVSVVEEDAQQDFYQLEQGSPNRAARAPDDCCEFDDLLGSEAFFDTVTAIIDSYCCPDETDAPPVEAELPVLTVLKATSKTDESAEYGFITLDGKFVNFESKANAEGGLRMEKEKPLTWYTKDPAEYTFSKIAPEVPQLTVLKGVRENGKVEYGFLTPDGFVNYGVGPESDEECIEMAEEGLSDYLGGDTTSWHYEKPEDYTFTEVENG